MKKNLTIVIIISILVGVMFIFTSCNNKKKYAKIDIRDNGSTLNHETYLILDEEIIKFKTSSRNTFEDWIHKDSDGYSASVQYYFEGIKEGKTEIWVVDMFPGKVEKTIKYEVSVDSNLKAKIINKSADNLRREGGLIEIKAHDDVHNDIVIDIADNSIVRNVYIWYCPNDINFVGLKEGSTTITIKEKSGEEKHYKVSVDASLNVEMKEI